MLRLGIVDFDSSHCVEFTRRINHVGMDDDQLVDGARVIVGCAGESLMSPERIPGHRDAVAQCGVELVDQAEDMFGRIDGVLILSICGSAHLQRVAPFLKAGIPAFVDKPFACTLEDAQSMFDLAKESGVSLWSASGMRFCEEILQFQQRGNVFGSTWGVLAHGPAKRADGNPGLLHYGIHATEVLCTLMGTGCQNVVCQHVDGADVVTGEWKDGQLGTLRGQRQGSTAYGFVGFCEHGVIPQAISARYSYRNLCREIVRTFETGKPPVRPEETLQIIQFCLAALESERRNGAKIEFNSRTN